MATRKSKSDVLPWHPSLKKVFKGCEQWWQIRILRDNELERRLGDLRAELNRPGLYLGGASTLNMIWFSYSIHACIISGKGMISELPCPLRWGIAFRSLEFREQAGKSLPHEQQPLFSFHSSMAALGPTLLSQWELGKLCAEQLVAVAEKDMRVKHEGIRKDSWGKGTNDAFVIWLLSQAYGIPTHYQPVRPFVEPYRQLLDVWRTTDIAVFQAAMQAAAEFHIQRSKAGGAGKLRYEFEDVFDVVYPGELLAVQTLRRREGLPEFAANHVLVDTPWSLLRDLPDCEPHPLAVEAEQRLKQDFPSFR